MIVFLANNCSGLVHHWATRLPGRVGHLWSPDAHRKVNTYPWIQVAFDNGRFASTEAGRRWDEALFIGHCDRIPYLPNNLLFLTVPDVPRNGKATLYEWKQWEPKLRKYECPLAFVVQDGLTPADVPDEADWIFVGGSDQWRYSRITDFLKLGKPVHVGRINGVRLWQMDRIGVTSVDGTGWFRGDRWMIDTLETYFRAQLGEVEIPQVLKLGQHPDQLDLLGPPGVDLKTAYYHAWQMNPQRPNYWERSLPKEITQEHILKAMQNWTGTPPEHRPHKWVVLHDGLPYPPKLLVSRAAFYAIGQYWQPHLFSGGRDLHGFLRRRFKGIKIVPIESLEATSQNAWTLQQMQIHAYH